MRLTYSVIGAFVCLAVSASAQVRDNGFTFKVGGGYTPAVSNFANRVDNGWNVVAGAGYRFNRWTSLLGEFGYNNLGVNQNVLNNLSVPDGTARVWSVTAQPVFHLTPSESRFGAYVTAGGGFYRRTVEFTQPTTSFVTVYDPWFGYYGNVGVPTNEVLGSFSSNAGGVNGGVGLSALLSSSSGVRLFVEGRYHHAFTSRSGISYIPLTVGLSW